MAIIADKTFSTKIGEPGAPGNTHTLILNGASGDTYLRCTFDGDGIKLDNCTNLTFQDCVIKNCQRTAGNHQGICAANLTNVTLQNVQFINCQWAAIFNGLIQKLLIDGGSAKGCGIHLKAALSNGSTIEQRNFLTTDSAAYYQSEFTPLDKMKTDQMRFSIHDCAMVRPIMGTAALQSNTGGWSVPGEAAYVEIFRNYFDGTTQDGRKPVKGGFLGPLMVIEMGAKGGKVYQNWIANANDPVSVNTVSQNCGVNDNLIQNCLETANMQGGAPVGSNVFGQNDDKVILPADGGWKMVGLTPPGSITPPPIDIEARVKALEDWRALMRGANK